MNTNERAPVGEELREIARELDLLGFGMRGAAYKRGLRELADRLRELAAREQPQGGCEASQQDVAQGQTSGGKGSFGEGSAQS